MYICIYVYRVFLCLLLWTPIFGWSKPASAAAWSHGKAVVPPHQRWEDAGPIAGARFALQNASPFQAESWSWHDWHVQMWAETEIFRETMRLGLAVTCLVHWQKRGSGPSGPCISEAAKLCSRHKHIFFGRKTLIPCLQVPSCPIIHPVTGFVLLASAAAFRALQVAEKSPELQLMDRHFSIF
jgi:hypothetical protein